MPLIRSEGFVCSLDRELQIRSDLPLLFAFATINKKLAEASKHGVPGKRGLIDEVYLENMFGCGFWV